MRRAAPVPQPVCRHNPLADDVLSAGHLRTKSNKRKARADDDEGLDYVDAKSSRRILQIGQDLAQEEADELKRTATLPNPAFDFGSRLEPSNDSDDEGHYGDDDVWGDEEEIEEVVRFTWPLPRHSIDDTGTGSK